MNDQTLLQETFKGWKEEMKEEKEKKEGADRVKELEKKLGDLKSTQVENTKKVMMRMNADSDYALVGMVFQAFVAYHVDYAKNREFEDQVEQAELKLKEFQKQQSKGAQKVLEKMGGSTDS